MEMRNDRETYNVLNSIIKDAITSVAEYILGLIEINITQIVYGSGNIPKIYDRTWEFLDSWTKTVESDNRLNEVIATIFSDPSKMHYDYKKYIHGSIISGDMTEEMSRLIEEGLGGHFIFGDKHPAAKPRQFFKATINTLNRSGQLQKMFEREMAIRGIQLNKKSNTIGYMMDNEIL